MNSRVRELEKGFLIKYILATLCLVLVFAVAFSHFEYMDREITDLSKTYLSKIADQNAEILSSEIQSSLQPMNVMARMIGNQDEINLDEVMQLLAVESRSSDLVSIGVVLSDGSFAFTPVFDEEKDVGELLLPSDWEYIRKTMAGYVGLQGSPAHMINGRLVNLYARPIYHGLQTDGALVVLFNSDFFEDLNFPKAFENGSCSYIADQNGSLIYHPNYCSNEESFSEVQKALSRKWALDGGAGEELKEGIQRGLKGTIAYNNQGQKMYISYVPVNFRGWYLISMVFADVAEEQQKSLYDGIVPIFLYILLVVLALSA